MLTPIETAYNGYLFRSRLEARYAVYFDYLRIKYEYEPEGYKLAPIGTKRLFKSGNEEITTLNDEIWYLPDFRLDLGGIESWLEIKGKSPTDDEVTKLLMLAYHSEQLCYLSAGTIGDHMLYLAFTANSDLYWHTTAPHTFAPTSRDHAFAVNAARSARFENV